jgi:hypothetical protein
MSTPRGIRNNNPLNIRLSKERWQGQIAPSLSGRAGGEASFCQFQTMQYGYRAAFKLLKTYMGKYRCHTIRQIIHKWAPPRENDTNAYVKRVAGISKLNPDVIIAFWHKQTMIDLAYAMTIVENGIAVDRQIIEQGYDLVSG